MKCESSLKRVIYIAIVLYILDIIFLGGGNLTKIGGISTRILFFAVAILACIPGMLKDFKKYITNKYCLSVGIFMVLVALSLVMGIINGNSRIIMITDVKGFLNILIVFPMIYVLDTKEKLISVLKIMITALLSVAIVALALSFYMRMPVNAQATLYRFFNSNVLCGIASLHGNATRVFFHTAGRLFFAGFMFLLTFAVTKADKKFIKEAGLAVFICACFISYTRSIYLAIFVCFVAFIIFVNILFKEKVKSYFISILRMSVMTLIFVLILGFAQGENLISVAINRCLLATIEIEEPLQTAEQNIQETETEAYKKGTDSTTKKDKENKEQDVQNQFDNIDAEKSNLEIRELRKELAIENIKRHPIFGNGLGKVNDINGEHIEYFYLDLLSKMGIVGALAFFMPFILCVYDLIRYRECMLDEDAMLLFSAILSVLFLFVISYFNPCMNTNVGLVIYCLMACIAHIMRNNS